MSKITKQHLNERLLMVETLLGLHRKLPEQISVDQANNAIFRMQCALSNGREIAERQPKLKVLDQSVFDDKPENINWAVVTKGGAVLTFQLKPAIVDELWDWTGEYELHSTIDRYDASNWQNSLIERESRELTGSDLAKAYFKAGGKPHVCYVGDDGDENTNDLNIELITRFCPIDGFISSRYDASANAILIDSNGNELTASEVGL